MQNENKEERFKRVAEKRVQNIIKAIRGLSQLTNKKVYEWNNSQLTKIFSALEKELDLCKDCSIPMSRCNIAEYSPSGAEKKYEINEPADLSWKGPGCYIDPGRKKNQSRGE